MTSSLSEEQIKNIAIRYLKEYYRYRPKTEKHLAYLLRDQKLEGDITVDVMLVFDPTNILKNPLSREKTEKEKALELIKERKARFIASCEATSRQVKEELYYKLDRHFWLWESLATALFFTTGLFLYAETAPDYFPAFMDFFLYPFEHHLPLLLIQYAVLFTAFFFLLTAWIALKWNKTNIRYRYIYAIRQFQAYSANEQWIAFAEDVFSEDHTGKESTTYWKDNPYFLELYRQATKNGTGLLLITQEKKVIPILTAAREQIGKDRRIHRKLLPENLNKTLADKWNKLRPKPKQTTWSLRQRMQLFHRPVLLPALLSIFFSCITGFIIYQHWLQRPGARQSSHATELRHWKYQKESSSYLLEYPYLDTPFWPVKLPFLFDSTQFIDPITLSRIRRKQKKKILPPLLPPKKAETPPPTPSPSEPLEKSSPCQVVSFQERPVTAVVYGIWPQKKDARKAQTALQEHGIESQILPAYCLHTDFPIAENDYLLILGTPLPLLQQAEEAKRQMEVYLQKKQLLHSPLALITFNVPQ